MIKKLRILKKILLYALFATFFVISSVLLVFYASGYKINWKAKKVQKTGILLLSYKENDLEIFIDGQKEKLQKNKSPINILNSYYTLQMLPGEYTLEIKAKSYNKYQRKIVIEEELVTKLEDIFLIPSDLKEEKITSDDISSYALSPDKKSIVYQTINGQIFKKDIFKADVKEDIVLDENLKDKKVLDYIWNKNGDLLVLKIQGDKNDEFYFIDINNEPNRYNLKDRFSYFPFFGKIYFSSKNSDELFGLSDKKISKVAVRSNEIQEIANNITHLKQKDGFLYYYEQEEKKIIQLEDITLRKNAILENFFPEDDFEIVPLGSNVLIKNSNALYFIKDKNNLEKIDSEIKGIFEKKDDKGLFYLKNNNDIFWYDLESKETKIITRFSQNIKSVKASWDGKNIIYIAEESIGAVNEQGSVNQKIKDGKYDFFEIIEKEKILILENNQFKLLYLK